MERDRTKRCTGAAIAGAVVAGWAIAAGVTSAVAQSAQRPDAVQSSALPAVTVEAPSRPRPRASAQRRAMAPAAASRAGAQRNPAPAVARTTGDGPAAERANGPVQGMVAGRSASGTKTDTPILETPQAIAVVTQDQIRAQQAQSLNQALRYTPGILTELYGAASTTNDVKVRVFLAPRYLDGLKLPVDPILTFAQAHMDPWGLERIEVLKGPSSGLYGETSPGGLLNMVSKRPTAFAQNQIELQTGSYGRAQAAFDLSGPLDKNGELLYRLTGLGRLSDSVIDYNHEQHGFIAPSFTWRPDNDTSFTFLSNFTRDRNDGQPQQYVPAYGTLYPNINGRIPYSRNFGEPSFDRSAADQNLVGYVFEHRFNEVFQFRQNLRYSEVTSDVTSFRNEFAAPDMTVTARSANQINARSRSFAIDNQMQADFATGPLQHKLLAGVDYVTADSFAYYAFGAAPPLNIYAPVYGIGIPSLSSLTPVIKQNSNQDQLGFYLQDQIKVDRFVFTLTGRHDHWQADTTNQLNLTALRQSADAWTGRAGVSYVFDSGVAPYVSYSTSFEPVVGLSRTDQFGNVFKPTTGQGGEVGIKFQPPGTKALFTVAAFDITQQNVATADPSNPFFNIQTGEVRVKGFELDARASLSRELDVIAGFTHLQPIVTQSTTGNIGRDVVNIPRDYASLWGLYTFRSGPAAGLGLGAGVRYIGQSYADPFNAVVVPSYGLVDALVSYDFSYLRHDLRGLKLQVNASNLFNKYYVSTCFTGLAYCALGAPRTVLATLSYAWN
ncbi:TonB-dependent siderophore receptor [Bradyrhizobium sp. U87765 SZCCT0131]|nr:TonB-dependent siderophore receptor [Bradyrhizobium sp. U87765 SZCCT0131]MBR1260671.1 TonB-dependent siderophore receptor [Bradyrhizobium sp. U87765 SZCCT0134]MBR1303881.1 TonB-dependent siderophore receptor [Bradyrhizobium sp. U87765 SZCCT0110]MBR1319487.1 TonB-dependent siderophore receptor [Bradyrhizobium sp. U87765 SZCCT0109]MBR1347812.1 TonB-dependent siderophore receptor [Bradyrhizobium sp. U87765 SZCCT0048]